MRTYINPSTSTLLIILAISAMAKGDYECVCNYNVEERVYSQPSFNSAVSGFMYEFDCKPMYKDINHSDANFQAVQFERKIVYVPVSSSISTQICQGSIPTLDAVRTTPSTTTSTTSTQATTSGGYVTTMKPTSSPMTTTTTTTMSTTTIIPTVKSSTATSQTSTQQPKTKPIVTTHSQPTTLFVASTPSNTNNQTTNLLTASFTGKGVSSSNINQMTSNTPTRTMTTQATTQPITRTTTEATTQTTTQTLPTTTVPLTSPFVTSTKLSTINQTTIQQKALSTSTKHVVTTTPVHSTSTMSTSLTTSLPQCPSGWLAFKTSCYKFHTSGRTTWDTANADCISQRSHIVFVETVDEDRFLQTYLSSHIDIHIHDNSDTGTWIGASERNNVGTWVWRDSYTQTDTNIGYSHWHPGQPDSNNEHCAAMIGRLNFEWHDYECDQSMFYVCEKTATGAGPSVTPPNNAVPIQPLNTLADCDGAWTAYKQSCYLFVTDQGHLEWDWANDYCKARNSHLAIIESRDEDMYLANQMRGRIDTDDDDDEDTGVWLGGTDEDIEGRWVWRDSLRRTDTPISGYTNWYPGEPDAGDHDKEEDCLCMIGNKGFQWQDYRCRDNMYLICEKPRPILSSSQLIG